MYSWRQFSPSDIMNYTFSQTQHGTGFPSSASPAMATPTFESAETCPFEPALFTPSPIMLLDDEIAALSLQLMEIELDESESKGKYAAGNPPDTKIASDNFQSEILGHLDFLKDLKMAHSIACAVNVDAHAIAQLTEPEKRARYDREYASRLQEGYPNEPYTTSSSYNDSDSFQDLVDEGNTINLDVEDALDTEPSNAYADQQAKVLGEFSQMHECDVCYEIYRAPFTILLPCADRYCIGCLKRLFLDATADESLFPARCCRQPIPLHYIQRQCSSDELESIQNAEIEFSTSDRTYCSNNDCARFIKPMDITGSQANCPYCFTETCTACKAGFHEDTDCPADPALQATLTVANEQGWQRCYSCRTMVELDHGCNHMTQVPLIYISAHQNNCD